MTGTEGKRQGQRVRAKGYETGTESKKQGQRVRDGDRVGDRDIGKETGTESY